MTQMLEWCDEESKAAIIKGFNKQSQTKLELVKEEKYQQSRICEDPNANVRSEQKNNNKSESHEIDQIFLSWSQ